MDKKSFEFEKEIIKLKNESLDLEHKYKMERLTVERESNRRFHEWALERERIKNSEMKKNLLRKYELNRHNQQ